MQTWLDLLDNRLAVAITHLPDVQQVMGIAIVWWPKIHKDPGPAAPTVNNHPIIQSRILCVGGLQVLEPCQVPAKWKEDVFI